MNTTHESVLRMATDIIAAYVRHNAVPSTQIPSLIEKIYQSLTAIDANGAVRSEPQKPAVSVRKSVTPDYIICLEDGRKLKMLKRHLRTSYNLTPEQYRAKWGLAPDYPMVAPNYAQQRSEFAKQSGLGRKPTKRTTRRATAKAAAAPRPRKTNSGSTRKRKATRSAGRR